MRQSIISLLLVLSYAIGLAHHLVPHCDGICTSPGLVHESGDSHHHHHHDLNEENPLDHKHILHNGHLDGGVYDFIICVLSDTLHLDDNCELIEWWIIQTNENSFVNDYPSSVAIIDRSLDSTNQKVQETIQSHNFGFQFSGPFLRQKSFRRGPPFSC